VRVVLDEYGGWTFFVMIGHLDTGWDEYADGWEVVTPDGVALKVDPNDAFTRVLEHPHVDEQPFTCSKRGIIILPEITQVSVRADDIVDGFGGQEILVDLGKESGAGFEVEV
jgi:hypothetical protein